MAFTLANAKTFLQDWDRLNSSGRGVRNQIKICNDARHAMAEMGKYDHDRRIGRLAFAGEYTTGTASVNAAATATTGSGTTWTAGMVGRFIRFAGERLSYEIATFSSVTSLGIADYQGESNLSGATYSITNERVALPTLFRDFQFPILDTYGWKLEPRDIAEIRQYRTAMTDPTGAGSPTGIPRFYATEWASVSGVPTPYVMVYPTPQSKRVIDFPYYVWPSEVSVDADTFGLPLHYEPVFREFLKAYLYQEQGLFDKFTAQLAIAHATGQKSLSNSRLTDEQCRRDEWSPELDPSDNAKRSANLGMAAGEPFYI